MDPEASEVVADVAALAAVAENASTSEAVLEAVIEGAQQRVEQAERTAEEIAAAAMESARGRELEELRKDFFTWRSEQQQFQQALTDLSSQMQTLMGQVSALSTLHLASQQPEMTGLSSLTPPASEAVQEAITEVQEIIPASLSESVVAESPVPLAAAKRKRWI